MAYNGLKVWSLAYPVLLRNHVFTPVKGGSIRFRKAQQPRPMGGAWRVCGRIDPPGRLRSGSSRLVRATTGSEGPERRFDHHRSAVVGLGVVVSAW